MQRGGSMKRLACFLSLAVLVCLAAPALAGYYGFDDIPATGYYVDVTPGGARGPIIYGPGINFNGGVIMSDNGWAGLATSKSNLYGTSDYSPLADGSFLVGNIAFGPSFPGVYWSSVSFDIINGYGASQFSVVAYDKFNNPVDSDVVFLAAYPNPGAVAHLSVSAPAIWWLHCYTSQTPGSSNYAIDSINFTVVPVPSALLLLGSGLAGLAGLRKFRKS
jgi:hypothetical protein